MLQLSLLPTCAGVAILNAEVVLWPLQAACLEPMTGLSTGRAISRHGAPSNSEARQDPPRMTLVVCQSQLFSRDTKTSACFPTTSPLPSTSIFFVYSNLLTSTQAVITFEKLRSFARYIVVTGLPNGALPAAVYLPFRRATLSR